MQTKKITKGYNDKSKKPDYFPAQHQRVNIDAEYPPSHGLHCRPYPETSHHISSISDQPPCTYNKDEAGIYFRYLVSKSYK